jgi:hypothetical protein
MTNPQRLLLILAVTGLAIGIPVTLSRAEHGPAWTFALPAGAVFLGLFLVSLLWQKEIAKFDKDERLKIELARRHRPSAPDPDNKRAEESPHTPEVPTAQSG